MTPDEHEAREGALDRALKRVAWLVRSHDVPSHTGHLRSQAQQVEELHARKVLDLVLRSCELAIATGAPAADATGIGVGIADAFGVAAHIDITSNSVSISQSTTVDQDPISSTRIVRMRTQDFHRLAQLEDLHRRIVAHEVDVDEARTIFEEIALTPRTYRGWVVTVAMAVMGAALAALFGGGPSEILASMLVVSAVEAVVVMLGKGGWPLIFVQAAGGAISTLGAVLFMVLRNDVPLLADVSPSVVAASGLVSLLAGLGLVSASRDALDGFYLTAVAGLFEVTVATVGIVIGVIGTLWIAVRMGVVAYLASPSSVFTDVSVQTAASALLAVTVGVTAHMRPRQLVPVAFLGLFGWWGYWLTRELTGESVAAAFAGAIVVGFGAQLGHTRWRLPVVALVTVGVVPLLPGLALYRGIYSVVETTATQGGGERPDTVGLAVALGAALAIGSSFGVQLARPLSDSLALPRTVITGITSQLPKRRRRAAGIAGGSGSSVVVKNSSRWGELVRRSRQR